jgi:sec-independent protein translocase protein TatA
MNSLARGGVSPPRLSKACDSRYSPPMPNIGTGEIILLLLLALLLFGAKRLPEIGRSLGSGMREFKDSVTGKTPAEQPELPTPRSESTVSAASQHEDDQA